MPLLWSITKRDEYPPDQEVVWAWDGHQMHQVRWTSTHFPGASVHEGAWEDLQGNPLAITHWLFLGESPGRTPEPPASP